MPVQESQDESRLADFHTKEGRPSSQTKDITLSGVYLWILDSQMQTRQRER